MNNMHLDKDKMHVSGMDKMPNLLEDLYNVTEYMKKDAVKISWHPQCKSNGNIWAIRGPKENLIVMLHYQDESKLADEEPGVSDEVCIKQEVEENSVVKTDTMKIDLGDKMLDVPCIPILTTAAESSLPHVSDSTCKADSTVNISTSHSTICEVNPCKMEVSVLDKYTSIIENHLRETNFLNNEVKLKRESCLSKCTIYDDVLSGVKSEVITHKNEVMNACMEELGEYEIKANIIDQIPTVEFSEKLHQNVSTDELILITHVNDNDKIESKNLMTDTSLIDMYNNSAHASVDHLAERYPLQSIIYEQAYSSEKKVIEPKTLQQHDSYDLTIFINEEVKKNIKTELLTPMTDISNSIGISPGGQFAENNSLQNKLSSRKAVREVFSENGFQSDSILDSTVASYSNKNNIPQDMIHCGIQEDDCKPCVNRPCEAAFDGNDVKSETPYQYNYESIFIKQEVNETCEIESSTSMTDISNIIPSRVTLHKQSPCEIECTAFYDSTCHRVSTQNLAYENTRHDNNITTQLLEKDNSVIESNTCEVYLEPSTENEDDGYLNSVEKTDRYMRQMKDLKKCYVLLEPIDITRLQSNQNKFVQEDKKCALELDIENNSDIQCSHCGKIFKMTENLKPSMKVATKIGRTSYWCPHCNKLVCYMFDSNLNVKDHLQEEKFIQCTVCGSTFSDFDSFNVHVQDKNLKHSECKNKLKRKKQVGGIKAHQCSLCDKKFNLKYQLEQHQVIHSGDRPYECSECNKSFSHKTTLLQHKVIHSGEKPFKCADCGKKFAHRSTLHQHRVIHSGKKPHKCLECGKRFSKNSTLVQHKLVHSGEKPYKCVECDKKFSDRSSLNDHKTLHSKEKPYACTLCEKKFRQKKGLSRHKLAVHSDNKPYECSQCGKTFAWEKSLKIHEISHSGIKPHECLQCGKKYAQIVSLNLHKLIHSEENPYQCTECGKNFTEINALNQHKLIHTGEKLYKCSQCSKSFFHKKTLHRHKIIHSVENPYQCSECSKSFYDKSSFNKHKLLHSIKQYKCSQCGKKFIDEHKLNEHKLVHSEEKLLHIC